MPIKEDIKIVKEETKSYPPLPENIYQVELLDVSSKRAETYNSKLENKGEKEYETLLQFQYTLLAGKNKEGESLRLRNVWDNFVPASLYIGRNGKNRLYKIVEALLERELTQEEEANGIDKDFLNELIGRQMRIGTFNKTSKSGDKVFTNADTYYPADVQMVGLTDEEREEVTVKDKKDDTESQEEEVTDEDTPNF